MGKQEGQGKPRLLLAGEVGSSGEVGLTWWEVAAAAAPKATAAVVPAAAAVMQVLS